MPLYEPKISIHPTIARASLLSRLDTDPPFRKSKKSGGKRSIQHHKDGKKKKRKVAKCGKIIGGSNRIENQTSLTLKDLVTNELCARRDKESSALTIEDSSLDSNEIKRRKERQMRFNKETSSKKDETMKTYSILDALNSSISSPRYESDTPKGKSSFNSFSKGDFNADGFRGGGSSEHPDFVGTCTNLEKSYLRLTTFPKPEDVRPLPILKQSFEHIKTHYLENEDHEWANEQLKSIRQDLAVQSIANNFSLLVYETHARLALEHGDMNEFNQCQSVIKSMTVGIGWSDGNMVSDQETDQHFGTRNKFKKTSLLNQNQREADEFAAYRLLYALVQNDPGGIKKELVAASTLIPEDQLQKTHRCQGVSSSRHAVLVTKAVVHSDYHMFFILYQNAPRLSGYLMDYLVNRVRIDAYKRIVASFRPTISVEFFRETLNFADLEETRIFLNKNNAIFVKGKGDVGPPFWVDCKASR